MNCSITFAAIICYSGVIYAGKNINTPQIVEKYIRRCRSEVMAEIQKREGSTHWIEQAPSVTNGKTFRSPTKKFGTWLELIISAVGHPTLYITSLNATSVVSYAQDCNKNTKEWAGLNFKTKNTVLLNDWYEDEELKLDISKSDRGLIYVWSPEMVYSAKFFERFRKTAQKLKLKFIPLIDPRTNMVNVAKAEQAYAIPRSKLKLNSVELYMRNVMVHYPTSLIYQHGKIHENPIVGVMETKDLEKEIQLRLQELR